MKTYSERMNAIFDKMQTKKTARRNRNIAITSCLGLALIVSAFVLFTPFNTSAPDVSEYRMSEYYSIIQKINEATFQKPRFKNNYQVLKNQLEGFYKNAAGEDFAGGMDMAVPEANDPMAGVATGTNQGSYVEVTDNQVAGVVEADLFKRSDKYLYHLHQNTLNVYSIAGEDSKLLDSEANVMEDMHMGAGKYSNTQMYLSQDCKRVILITDGYRASNKESYVVIRSFNVEDPENIVADGHLLVSGAGISSRMVDGNLLLISKFRVRSNKDFSDESTFLPQVGTMDAMQSVAAEDIIAPDQLSSTQYTVVTKIDGNELKLLDTAAFLSYSDEIYVSNSRIFATRGYSATKQEDNQTITTTMTQISAISYAGETMEYEGSVEIEGAVKNQYSMDEYEGILRVVTSTNRSITEEENGYNIRFLTKNNVNLYCISLQDYQIAASIIGFAPEGETAESVRFDKNSAYVCTAEVITLTDPVYFFDLSDLNDITWKDTGTIDGYSTSLINFGEEYLLGIGYNEERGLKIEAYVESANGVISLASYEPKAMFSEEYKSYFIDRENQLLGIAMTPYEYGSHQYVLLLFNGYKFIEVAKVDVEGNLDDIRSTIIDGYLYILDNDLQVVKVLP